MSRHPCRKFLFKHHDLAGCKKKHETVYLNWLILHNCGISKPWVWYEQKCRRCGEWISLGGDEDKSRPYLYRVYLTKREYQELEKRYN